MVNFPEGTETPFARAVSAEIRAVLAARRLTLRDLATGAGFKSHNYVAIRLRDEKPFTLDDVEKIVGFLEGDITEAHQFIKRAYENHDERLWMEASDLVKPAKPQKIKQGAIYLLDANVITQHNLARLMGAAANADDPTDRIVVLLEGVGAVGSQFSEFLREAREQTLFTDDDWVQLEALANGSEGKPLSDVQSRLDHWWSNRGAIGVIELKGSAGQTMFTIGVIAKGVQVGRRGA